MSKKNIKYSTLFLKILSVFTFTLFFYELVILKPKIKLTYTSIGLFIFAIMLFLLSNIKIYKKISIKLSKIFSLSVTGENINAIEELVKTGKNINGEYILIENKLLICYSKISVEKLKKSYKSESIYYPAAFSQKPSLDIRELDFKFINGVNKNSFTIKTDLELEDSIEELEFVTYTAIGLFE